MLGQPQKRCSLQECHHLITADDPPKWYKSMPTDTKTNPEQCHTMTSDPISTTSTSNHMPRHLYNHNGHIRSANLLRMPAQTFDIANWHPRSNMEILWKLWRPEAA